MDGTIADYNGAMRDALKQIASPFEPELPDNFHEAPAYIEFRSDLIKRQPGFWANLKRIEIGFEVIDVLRELKYNLMVLTKGPTRTTSAWTEKRDWCHQHLPGVPVTITEDKSLTYGKVLFDDYPPYIISWLEHRPRGKVIMLDSPWNKDFQHERVFRINSNTSKSSIRDLLSSF